MPYENDLVSENSGEGTANRLTLVSHYLCPYSQRASISLTEKNVPHERINVDLASPPEWFRAISPMGNVPLLRVAGPDGRESVLFESAVILEFLEDTLSYPLHPAEPLERAQHRGWIEFSSTLLNGISRLYSAPDRAGFETETRKLRVLFTRLEAVLGEGPWFSGNSFRLVDAAFAPVFRYFDTFDAVGDFDILEGMPKISAWRRQLAARLSVRAAVGRDYPQRLTDFLVARNSYLSGLIRHAGMASSRAELSVR